MKWISITEKMPPVGKIVLLCGVTFEVKCGYYSDTENGYLSFWMYGDDDDSEWNLKDIIYWAPLPSFSPSDIPNKGKK